MFGNKLRLTSCVFSFLFCFLSNVQMETLLFSEARLKDNAEGKGLGYKTANLMELENVIKNVQQEMAGGIKVQVPEFLGVTSASIKRFFLENGVNIARRWDEIVQSLLEVGRDPLTILENPEKRSKFISESEKLARDIESAEIKNKEEFVKFSQPFLDKAKGENLKLMVRSTGREDTKELPNAGGNYSEPNVAPNVDLIINAIKKVVASYFKEKSLMQRIDGGDKKIFDQPLTPVLLQRMIGEKDVIPVGCVVYTRNPENNDVITVIQAGWGHNEGIVTSSVNVDTFYIKDYESKGEEQEVTIKKVLQVKKYRIVPTEIDGVFGLQMQQNPEEIKKIQVLSDAVIKEIDKVAKAIDKYYNEAMDIELVYDPGAKIIYLVQARPLQIRDLVSVSYVENPQKISEENKIACNVISAAGSGVKHITNKNQVILASTLEEALNLYNSKQVTTQISAVIVKGNAEATSHAAAIFRGAGKAILVIPNFEKITQWLSKDPINLFIDTQRETIFRAEVGQEIAMKAGWLKYPIYRMISVTEEVAYPGPRQQIAPLKGFLELLEMLKTEGITEQLYKDVVASLLDKIHTLMFKEKDPERLAQLKNIYAIATLLEREIKINLAAKGLKSLELLYPVNFLEAILSQLKNPKYVDIYSVKTILEDRVEQNKTKRLLNLFYPQEGSEIDNLSKDILLIVNNGYKAALTKEVGDLWINFIAFIIGLDRRNRFPDKDDLGKLKTLFNEIEKFDITMMWINTYFALQYQNNPKEFLAISYQELIDSIPLLKVLSEKKDWLLNVFNIEKFRDPKIFQKEFDAFKTQIGDFFIAQEFIDGFKDGTNLYKEMALSFMEQLVDLLDRSIKELKGSMQFAIKGKVEKFQAMLGVYLNLLKNWFNLVTLDQKQQGNLLFVEQLLEKKITKDYESQLNNSKTFNVISTSIGEQRRSFQRYKPNTLEDIFTFVHQSLINVISLTYKNVFPDKDKLSLPDFLKDAIKKIERIPQITAKNPYPIKYLKFNSYKFIKNNIVFKYSIPLRTHSIVLEVKFDNLPSRILREKFLFIRVVFYGDDEEGRWERMSDYVEISSSLLYLTLSENISEYMTSKFEFKLSLFREDESWTLLDHIIKIIIFCIDLSFDTDTLPEKRGLGGTFEFKRLYELVDNSALINEAVFNLSVSKDRIHWLLPFIELNKIKEKIGLFREDVLKIFKKLLDDNSDYYVSTLVFLYKILNDPRDGNSIYYLINKENYERLLPVSVRETVLDFFWNRVFIILIITLRLSLEEQVSVSEKESAEIIKIANWGINGCIYSEPVFAESLKILDILADKTSNIDGIKPIADRLVQRGQLEEGFGLYAKLVQKGTAFEDATSVALEIMNNDFYINEDNLRNKALQTLIALIGNGKAVKESLLIAAKLVKSKNIDLKIAGLNFYSELVQKGYGSEEARGAAKLITYDYLVDNKVLVAALNLWKNLIEKGYFPEDVISVAQMAISTNVDIVQSLALNLWEALFKQGKGFDAASKSKNLKLKELATKYKLREKGERALGAEVPAEEGEPVPAG